MRRSLALLTAAMLCLAGGEAMAQGSGQKSAPPRDQVDTIDGDYIQIETLWVPVISSGGSVLYRGLVLRLWPGDATRYEACVVTPYVGEHIIIALNQTPVTNDIYSDSKLMRQRISDLVDQKAGKGVFKTVEILKDFKIPDEGSATLSRTCR